MNRVRIKICGITNIKDALLAIELGADALGFILCPSPRQISIQKAGEIINVLPPFVNKVAVVKDFNRDQVQEIINNLSVDTLQFSGSESEDFCLSFNQLSVIKAIHIENDQSINKLDDYKRLPHYLLDTYSKLGGGSGKTFNWHLAVKAKSFGRILLAGGLNPDNIKDAIGQVQPYGIDVSSGVEKEPGIKDPVKLKALFHEIRSMS